MKSPLAQRLIIYKFTVLEIFHDDFPYQKHLGPACYWLGPHKPPPVLWLQMIGKRRNGSVGMTNSLSQAIKTRKRNPFLPIVLVRPLFSPTEIPTTAKFRKLARPFPGLSKSDPFLPMRWGHQKRGFPDIQLNYRKHPKMCLLTRLNLDNSILWPDETGTLYTQEAIGRNTQNIAESVFRENELFLEKTYAQLKSCPPPSIWAVCSKRQSYLGWFQRDVLKKFGRMAVFRTGSDKAIHSKNCVQFFLFTDRWLMWQSPDPELVKRLNGIIELDTWSGSYAYRCYRLQSPEHQQVPTFITNNTCEGWAKIQAGRHSLHFECHMGQWYSAATDEIRGENMTRSFYHRFRVFELIGQTRQGMH